MLGKEPNKRKLGDWIDSFLDWTESAPSPLIFRKWAAITAVAGAAERRIWTRTTKRTLWPNLYTLLVAPPAVGKTEAINPVGRIWHHVKELKVAPLSVTRASLVDELAEVQKKLPIVGGADVLEFSSLLVTASEFGVLMPAHDLDFMSVLNVLYDNPEQHSEKRRTQNINHYIPNPQLTILAGTQPGYLSSLLPEEAWNMGFMSRQIMVYSGTPIHTPLFPEDEFGEDDKEEKALFKALLSDMTSMTQMYGGMAWTPEAKAELSRWRDQDQLAPVPEHSKLIHYNARRILHVIKLSMISSMSRGNDKLITLPDLSRARDWLLEAETTMPDIFREMVGRNDAQVLTELHFFMWREWIKQNQKALHVTLLVHFLQTKVPSERIDWILKTAERAGMIARVAGTNDQFLPRPKNEHGLE